MHTEYLGYLLYTLLFSEVFLQTFFIEGLSSHRGTKLRIWVKNENIIAWLDGKPATIAYYELTQTYCIPLIYVYEETKKLKWLISKETIKTKFGIQPHA